MTPEPRDLERECVLRLRRHLADEREATLHSAYELGRASLADGVGVLDMGAALLRAAFRALGGSADAKRAAGVESFVLEALSPFEMALRGASEANHALRRLDEVRESEIRRIAHELHDSAGQLLASVHLALDDLERDLDPGSRPRLERAKVLLVRVEERLRRLSHEFRPVVLDDLGLVPALASLADSVSRRTGIRVAIEGDTCGRLNPAAETALYRIVQEAVTNVTRHARASRATVNLRRGAGRMTCVIEDDGVGLPAHADSTGRSPGIGLRGIRERAAGLGGTLTIHSEPGRGVRLTIDMPMEEENVAAHRDRG